MPATSDDDIFKRMFANFVRKRHANAPTTSAAAAAAASSSQHHHQQQYAQQHGYNNGRASSATPVDRAPDALRKVATDYNGRGFVPAPLAPELHTARHTQHHSSHAPPALHRQPSRHADSRPSAFTSLLGGRSAQPDAQRGAALGDTINPSSSRKHSTASKPGTKGSKGSRGSKGSKGSDKPVSASTEDAPPRKRTRTHPHPALQRSQSAHASLHSSRNAKSEKMRNNSRFNLPPAHAPAPAGPSNLPPSTNPNKAIKSFPCDQCPAVFAQKGQLSRHTRRVHEKLRPHACEHCGKLFGARSDRTRHIMIVHKKVRQFPCDRCGFQFQAKTHLEAHIRTVHEGERPFRCEQCGFSFGLKSNLLTHERAVHYREAKWNCTECNTAFNRKHDMYRHMKLMHDIDSTGNGMVGTGRNT